MQKEPPPFVWAVPDEKNILTCTPFSDIRFTRLTHAGCTFTGNYILVRRHWCDLRILAVLRVLARSARFPICRWGIPWSTALPLGVSF